MKRKICYILIGAALCMITPVEGIAQMSIPRRNVVCCVPGMKIMKKKSTLRPRSITVGLSMPTVFEDCYL